MMSRRHAALRTLVPFLAGVYYALTATAHHPLADEAIGTPSAPSAAATFVRLSGDVTAVTIDDQVTGVVYRYVGLKTEDGTTLAITTAANGSAALEAGMRIDAEGRREGGTLFLSAWQASPGARHPLSAEKATAAVLADGTLQMLHADDFATGRSEYLFEIQGKNGQVTRLTPGIAAAALKPGMTVTAEGTFDTKVGVLAPPASPSKPSAGRAAPRKRRARPRHSTRCSSSCCATPTRPRRHSRRRRCRT